LEYSRENLPKWLFTVVASLALLHIAVAVVHYRFVELPCQFLELSDLEEGESLGTMLNVALLALASYLSFRQAYRSNNEKLTWRVFWTLLAVGFCIMTFWKISGTHGVHGLLFDRRWVALTLPLLVMIAASFVPFLLHLPANTRNLLIVSAAIYLIGAVGVETALGWLPTPSNYNTCNDRVSTFGYSLASVVEGSMELTGLILFAKALIGLREDTGP